MSKIIPCLLPYTKTYGLYGPGFTYSLSGSSANNPILAASLSPSFSPYIEREQVLAIGASYGGVAAINSHYQLTIEITHSTGVLKYSIAGKTTGVTTNDTYEPCGTIANCVGYGYWGELEIRLSIFSMLRSGIDISSIKVQTNAYIAGTYSCRVAWYDASTAINLWPGVQVTDHTVSISCPTSLTVYKTITLDKSTGFVFTVT